LRRYFPSHSCGNNDQTQGVVSVWTTTGALIVIGWALQIVGRSLFERRRPALLDNPIHMLMSPMFIVAKLFVALGFRRDLAAVLSEQPCRQSHGRADFGQQP
jgi:uncharacterized membrane protein YGL010W